MDIVARLALAAVCNPQSAIRTRHSKDGWLLLNVWAIFTFVLFSFSHAKLPAYILPIFPALAVMLALRFFGGERATESAPRWAWRICLASSLLLPAIFPLLVKFAFPRCAARMVEMANAGSRCRRRFDFLAGAKMEAGRVRGRRGGAGAVGPGDHRRRNSAVRDGYQGQSDAQAARRRVAGKIPARRRIGLLGRISKGCRFMRIR